MNAPMLQIGGAASAEAVNRASEKILAILEARADEKTKQAAIKALVRLTNPGPPRNTSVAGCTFTSATEAIKATTGARRGK